MRFRCQAPAGAAVLAAALLAAPMVETPAAAMPFRAAGLTEREAAAFLLDRFAYGPRPGEVDRVVAMGLEAWLEAQLEADLPEPDLEAALDGFEALDLPASEMAETMMAAARADDRGGVRGLLGELLAWKLYRAVLAENQLREVMEDLWMEHLYVSLADPQARPFVLSYERDALRPRALASFPELLRARGNRGLNENFARELLELHTLGVDGGYTEADVREVARAFTGWTLMPPGPRGEELLRRLERAERLGGVGFVVDGDFLFRADTHDAEAKTVLGTRLPGGRGVEDGEAVLDLLAARPATARHVARALAVRFVADEPPASLVDRLAAVYLDSGGDIRTLLRALVASRELWESALAREKVKSPFELAASALRAVGARVERPSPVLRSVEAMGQRPYADPAPTGYPETAEGRLDSGVLLERLRFGERLAAGAILGVSRDPGEVLGRTPGAAPEEILDAALAALLPGRRLTAADLAAAGPPPADPRQAVAFVLSSPEFQVR